MGTEQRSYTDAEIADHAVGVTRAAQMFRDRGIPIEDVKRFVQAAVKTFVEAGVLPPDERTSEERRAATVAMLVNAGKGPEAIASVDAALGAVSAGMGVIAAQCKTGEIGSWDDLAVALQVLLDRERAACAEALVVMKALPWSAKCARAFDDSMGTLGDMAAYAQWAATTVCGPPKAVGPVGCASRVRRRGPSRQQRSRRRRPARASRASSDDDGAGEPGEPPPAASRPASRGATR